MVEIMARGLKNGTLALDRAKQIARFYLTDMEKVSSDEELEKDLEIMEEQIPEMKDVVLTEKMRTKQFHENEIKAQVEALLKEGKVEEAATLARQAGGK